MRHVVDTVLALAVLVAACGGWAPSLGEYVERMQTATDELEAAGEQFVGVVETAVDPTTGAVVNHEALQELLDETAASLEGYYQELEAIEPPSEVADAHGSFQAVAEPRLKQWVNAAARATEIDSLDELVAVTLKSSEFTAKCVALEHAVDENGLTLDLDCD